MELNQFRDVDLVIDKANDNYIQRQFVSQGDYRGRTMTVQVTDNGIIGKVPGLMLNLRWRNQASGLADLSAFECVDEENSIFRIEYPEQMMTPGKVVANIQVIQNGQVTHLKTFEMTVQALAGEMTGIVDKAEYQALTKTLAEANRFKTDIEYLETRKADKEEINKLDANKAEKTDVDSLMDAVGSMASAAPKDILESIDSLNQKYPTGASFPVIVLDQNKETGYAYVWNGNVWVKGASWPGGTVEANSVDGEKLVDTDLLAISTNLINPNSVVKGYYVKKGDGGLYTSAYEGIYCTDYILVKPGKNYMFTAFLTHPGAWYDENKEYISDLWTSKAATRTIVEAPENAQYLRWNGDVNAPLSSSMIVQTDIASWPNVFVPYSPVYETQWLKESNGVSQKDLFATKTGNLFNPKNVEYGVYLNNSGLIVSSEKLGLSDFIPIDPFKKYVVSCTFASAGGYYDGNKKYIARAQNGETSDTPNIFSPPSNGRFLRVNVYNPSLWPATEIRKRADGYMLLEGDSIPDTYVPYAAKPDWLNTFSDALAGQKVVNFGDSITNYDGRTYIAGSLKAGELVYGYQAYLRRKLLCETSNQGISGQTTQQIMERSKAFDYTGYSLVTFFCGVNNFLKDSPGKIGTVAEIGSDFDLTTFCGAYQSGLEDVITRFPSLRIGIIIPYKAWNEGALFPREYVDRTIEIAKLYGIPFVNLYDEAGINQINRDRLFVDNQANVSYYFHVNNTGYKMIADLIVPFVERILISNL